MPDHSRSPIQTVKVRSTQQAICQWCPADKDITGVDERLPVPEEAYELLVLPDRVELIV